MCSAGQTHLLTFWLTFEFPTTLKRINAIKYKKVKTTWLRGSSVNLEKKEKKEKKKSSYWSEVAGADRTEQLAPCFG